MDAVTFFLTFPRSAFTHEEIYNHLNTIKPVVWARVAVEQHADGEPHVHVIVRFGARVKTRSNARAFDYMGGHPNIQVPRRIKDVLEYLAKDGNYRDFGPVPTERNVHNELQDFARRGDRDAFDNCAMANRVSFQWAEHVWRRHGTTSNTVTEAGRGTMCVQLQGLQFDTGSILIVGASGCGKSTWAKTVCPKPALWVTHMDDLKKLSNEHQCIIFDDMDFQHMPRTAQIHIVDQDDVRTIHCRHSTATIPARMPKIFTANQYPFSRDEAIERRLKVYNIMSFAV